MDIIQTVKEALGLDPSDRADPDMKRVLDALQSLNPKPIEDCEPVEARAQPTATDAALKVMRDVGIAPEVAGVTSKDITYPGASGPQKARIYVPDGQGPLPVVLYFRGGGFVIASLDVYDASPRAMAALTKAIFVSADYSMGPEHKFPSAHQDAFAAYCWLLANASTFGGNPSQIAVMGESAGGNLAANVAIHARDMGLPAPAAQILVYPLASGNLYQSSDVKNANAKPLNRAMLPWFVNTIISESADIKSPLLNIVHAELSGLAPATIINAGIDPLESDGEALADKLQDAGNPVLRRVYPGVTHEFFGMAKVVRAAAEAQALAADRLRSAFARKE
jgi:acetyl esterase